MTPKQVPDSFASWMAREMPTGTVIGDPQWWAARIMRAMRVEMDGERESMRLAMRKAAAYLDNPATAREAAALAILRGELDGRKDDKPT